MAEDYDPRVTAEIIADCEAATARSAALRAEYAEIHDAHHAQTYTPGDNLMREIEQLLTGDPWKQFQCSVCRRGRKWDAAWGACGH